MSWIPVLLLAGVAFAVAAFVFRLERKVWTALGAAIVFGLAGYAFQAHPGLPAPQPRSGPLRTRTNGQASRRARR